MSSASVFNSLRELFPQVDLRIIRAVSIEHDEDINEAIEFILSEVLPTENTTPDFSCIPHETGDNGPERITIPDDKPVSPFGTSHHIGGTEKHGLHSLVADGTKESFLWQPHLMFLDAKSKREEPGQEESNYNRSLSLNLNHSSEKEDDNLFYKAHNQNDCFESPTDVGTKKIILAEHHTKISEDLECASMSHHTDTEDVFHLRDEENILAQLDEHTISSTVFDNCESSTEYGPEKQNDINFQLNVCDDLSGCSSDACKPLNLYGVETMFYTPPVHTCVLSMPGVGEKEQNYQGSMVETYKDAIENENHNSFSLDLNYLEISSIENIFPRSLATRSGHAVSIDMLEESIMDAKSNKKSLVSSLEYMVSMMREVELLEAKSKQAKLEAVVAGRLILSKVEELRQIVKQSKDENDKESGQVYGERSILATEARELQSRLLRMSEERSKYLLVIEEIMRTLEERKLTAKDVIDIADLEKLENEEVALKALKEQELMRDALVAECQNLELEAEENSKLRNFLMDRGHVVDSLQGEIAIICEDILSLKERVDGPLTNKSQISSSVTKSLMASLSSSCGSSVSSFDYNGGSTSSSKRESHEKHLEVDNSTASLNLLEEARSNPLDDWELCDK